VLRRAPPEAQLLPQAYDYQAEADRRRGTIPPLLADYRGTCTIETFAVPFREGSPAYANIIARSAAGARLLCRVPQSESALLDWLTSAKSDPIGSRGTSRLGDD